MNAQMEWQGFWDDKEERDRQEEQSYWETWAEKDVKEPGTIAYVQLDVSLDSCYRPVYDIDEGGVNREYSNPHGWFMEQKDPKFYDPYYRRSKERITDLKETIRFLYFLG